MSFSNACNEVRFLLFFLTMQISVMCVLFNIPQLVEAVLLFMELQHEHMSKASRQQLTPEVSVSLTAEKHEDNNSTGTKCNVRGK